MDDRSNELQAKAQVALIEFLNTDLELGFTMLETARIQGGLDPNAALAIIEKVRTAVQTVRSLTGRVQDPSVWTQIHSRTDKLEAAVARFCSGPR